MEPMMRARQETPFIVGPAYQYAPRSMLFSEEQEAWPLMSYKQTIAHIADRLPNERRDGWLAICSGTVLRGQVEVAAASTARWIEQHGRDFGFRAPSVVERSRVMGLAEYHAQLGLTDPELYNAQGNSFDRALLPSCIGPTLRIWATGVDLPKHAFPTAAQVEQGYQVLRSEVEALGIVGLTTAPTAIPRPKAYTLLLGAAGEPAQWASIVSDNERICAEYESDTARPADVRGQTGIPPPVDIPPQTPAKAVGKRPRAAAATPRSSQKNGAVRSLGGKAARPRDNAQDILHMFQKRGSSSG